MDVNFVLGRNGAIYKIEVGFFDTVVEMKQSLKRHSDVPARNLIFLFKGHIMDDDRDVQFYGLYDGCCIDVLIDTDVGGRESCYLPDKRRKTTHIAVASDDGHLYGLIESWLQGEPAESHGAMKCQKRAILPFLPIDVIAEIISRLPVKTLLCLRTVCKSWRELIDSSGFALRLHLPRSRQASFARILIQQEKKFFHLAPEAKTDRLEEIHLPFPLLKKGSIHSACSRNGLLCFYQSPNYKRVSFCVFNPATRKYIHLPGVRDHHECRVHFCQILWDPLGGDKAGTYKVLVVLWRGQFSLTIIFTIGVDEKWRVLKNPFPCWDSEKMMECPCINGVMHCVCFDDKRMQSVGRCFVATFDIADERFREIKIPNACCVPRECYGSRFNLPGHHLVEVVKLKDTLSFLHINGSQTILENWLLTDYYNGVWTKKHAVNLEFISTKAFLVGRVPPSFSYRKMNVISKDSDGKILMKIDYKRDGRRFKDQWQAIFLSYDPQQTNDSNIQLLGVAKCGFYKRYAEEGLSCMGSSSWRGGYVESLVSLDDIANGCKKVNMKGAEAKFQSIWDIIDRRWDSQMHRPLHAVALYLNPGLYYDYEGIKTSVEIKYHGLFVCISRLAKSPIEQERIFDQLNNYRHAIGGFGIDMASKKRKEYTPVDWWLTFGTSCPELLSIAVRILGLTCSASPCERNWSTFERIHSKKRNRLLHKKLNDLAFVQYNDKLQQRYEEYKIRGKSLDPIILSRVEDKDEWPTDDEFIDEDEALTWNDVAIASGVRGKEGASMRKRKKIKVVDQRGKGKRRSDDVEEEDFNSEEETEEEDVEMSDSSDDSE